MGYFILILLTIKQIQVIHGPNQKDEKKKHELDLNFYTKRQKSAIKAPRKRKRKKKE